MRRLFNALLLKGLWKCEPIHAIMIWILLAFLGWFGSPYFIYHAIGAPEPATAPRYVGTLRVAGELQRSKTGWKPPKYFIRTSQGEIEIHCDYLPYPTECSLFHDFHKRYPEMIYEIGYDRYWGIDFIRYPANVPPRLQEYGAPHIISQRRKNFLKYHQTPAALFVLASLIYAYLVWQSYENSRPKRPPDTDTPSPKPDAAKESAALTQLKKTKSLFDR